MQEETCHYSNGCIVHNYQKNLGIEEVFPIRRILNLDHGLIQVHQEEVAYDGIEVHIEVLDHQGSFGTVIFQQVFIEYPSKAG